MEIVECQFYTFIIPNRGELWKVQRSKILSNDDIVCPVVQSNCVYTTGDNDDGGDGNDACRLIVNGD
jgi:hypothetical protein